MKKIVLLVFVLVLFSTAVAVRFVRPAVAEGTIYIMADGSVVGTTYISIVDNVTYTFTDNIYDEIVVLRDNIVVDGAGYTLQGTGAIDSKGMDLTRRSNITIKNMTIKTFHSGIELYQSSNNTIYGNTITANNGNGLYLFQSDNNNIVGNNLSNNNFCGIMLGWSSNNTLTDNIASNNRYNFGISGYDFSDFNNHIDKSNTVDGKPIYYLKSVSHTVYDAQTNVGTFCLINCNNITIRDLTLTKNYNGVFLWNSTNNRIENITATDNQCGIWVDNSVFHIPHVGNNTLIGNNVSLNEYGGIGLHYSNNNILTDNTAINNNNGIRLYYSSNNTITRNTVTNNDWDGIGLGDSNNNTFASNYLFNSGYGFRALRSSYNTITGNAIFNNTYGIAFGSAHDVASNNTVYHNNFINNTEQVDNIDSINTWDDGYPSGGNYWDDYGKVDVDGDGIGETPYVIDANNTDRYPLVVPLGLIPIIWDEMIYPVELKSNSTISRFRFKASQKMISFNVTGSDGTLGFCNLTIPNSLVQDLWQGDFTVLVDGEEPITMNNWTDGTYTYMYFTYLHSTHKVEIIPEFPTWTSMLLILIVLTVAIAIYKRRLLKTSIH